MAQRVPHAPEASYDLTPLELGSQSGDDSSVTKDYREDLNPWEILIIRSAWQVAGTQYMAAPTVFARALLRCVRE